MEKPVLGARLHDLRLKDASGALTTLARTLSDKPAIVLLLRTPVDKADCEVQKATVQETSDQLDRLGFAVVSVMVQRACKLRNSFELVDGNTRWSEASALLLDRDRVVRRVIRGGDATIIDDVRLWLDGMATFKAQCARCHGEDGRDTSYPGTKSLAGIGNHHTEAEIWELTQRAGFVDLSSFNDRAKRALSIFVAGL